MKRRTVRRLMPLFLTILLALITGLTAAASSVVPAFSIDIQNSAKRIIPLIEDITGADFPSQLQVLEVTGDQLVDVLMQEWDSATQQAGEGMDPLARLMAEYRALKNSRRILGKYSFIDKKVYIVTENMLELLPKMKLTGNWQTETVDAILAHELTHANDDFRFGTGKYYAALQDNEQALAYRAVTEGNAVYTASEICRRLGYQDRSLQLAATHEPEDPNGLLASGNYPEELLMYFQYSYGERFMRRLYEEGGVELAAKAFLQAPQYTSQIYRPEQYLSPVPVLPDMDTLLLQTDNFLPEGTWERETFSASELMIRLGFSRLGNESTERYLQSYLTGRTRLFSSSTDDGSDPRRMLVTAFYYLDPVNAADFLDGEEQLMLAQWSDIAVRENSAFQKVRRLEPAIGTRCIWSEANYHDDAGVVTNDQQIFLQCGNLVFEVAMFNMNLTDNDIISLLKLLAA